MRVDLVILPVCADKPDIDDAIAIIDPHYDAILLARDGRRVFLIRETATSGIRSFPRLCFRGRSKPYARTTAVFVDKFYAGRFQGTAHG